ncbi:MAG TPA: AsmA family protein [Burkholderiaceae bacterium]|nr:AsmA family protein [Burkholderiaceae bacterium]
MTAAAPSRRRWWRIVLVALVALALLVAGAYVALVRMYPPQRLAALLADQVRSLTGREFRIGGGLSFRLLPTIAVVAEDVALGNAPWGTRREMATIQRAAFEVALAPLLQGELHVLSIDVDGADVLLESNRQGHANWVFTEGQAATGGPPQADPGRSAPAVHLDKLVLSNARIAYRSGLTQTTRAVTIESLQIDVQGERTVLAARLAGAQRGWRLDGATGRYETLLQGQTDWPFDLRLQAGNARLAAKGSLDVKGTVHAALSARIDSADALTPWFEQAKALPMPIDASAKVERSATTLSADAVRLSLAGQTLTGKATVRTPGGTPQVELDVAAGSIDLARWGVAAGAAPHAPAAPASKAPLFADTPLPELVLPEFPLRARVRIEHLAAPGLPALGAVNLQIASTADRLVVDPLSLAVAGGQLRGRVELGARRGDALRATLRADATGLSLQALDAGSGERARGRADVQLSLEATGRTAHALAASTNGRVVVTVNDAALRGGAAAMERNILVLLLQALLPKQAQQADASLQIQCAVANLPLKNGVAAVDHSIAIETDKLAVAASGELNFAAETVTLGFHPVAKKGLGLDPASLAKLVRLEGPLRDPKVGIDMAGTAREAATVGAAVATAGLSLVGKRLLFGPEDTQACQHALAAGKP